MDKLPRVYTLILPSFITSYHPIFTFKVVLKFIYTNYRVSHTDYIDLYTLMQSNTAIFYVNINTSTVLNL